MRHVTKEQCGGEIEVKLGETIEIEFPENPTTGYRWQIHSSGGSVLELQDDSYQMSGQLTCGGGGIRRWCFRAVQEGAGEIEIEYRRSWEKQPAEICRIAVRVRS